MWKGSKGTNENNLIKPKHLCYSNSYYIPHKHAKWCSNFPTDGNVLRLLKLRIWGLSQKEIQQYFRYVEGDIT